MSILEIDQVTVQRGASKVLSDITLSYPQGKTSIIVGPTGSGKSTLLKVSAGLMPYEQGAVFFDGRNIQDLNDKEYQEMQRRTGFMFQDAALWSNKSLWDNLSYPILVHDPKIKKAVLERRINSSLESIHFNASPHVRPAQISAGERKIISFLRSIITSPEVLFLDDPTTSIDRKSFSILLDYIKDLQKKETTIIIVTENPLFIRQYSDMLFFLDRGQLLGHGTYEELKESKIAEIRNFFEEV